MATPPELSVRTELSRRPAQEVNDALALTKEQQALLNQHKVERGLYEIPNILQITILYVI